MTFKVNIYIFGLTKCTIYCKKVPVVVPVFLYAVTIRPCQGGGGGGSHVARLNFKMSRIGVCKCLLLIVGFAVTVAIRPREVVSCFDFILRTVITFWAMSLVGIYLGRASTCSFLRLKELFQVKNGGYVVTFF